MNDPLVGTRLGNYVIEDVLGRGGMGVVYAARDTVLERRVALKVLAPGFAEDDAFRARFERESRLAASLDHPNVVPVFDAGEKDGRLYIAMRLVAGTDLKKVIQEEGPLPPDRVAQIIKQVAGALDDAHAAGLVHRDVKPANVLVTPFGEAERRTEHVYLTDFGVTKRSGSQTGLTETGAFVGTIDYIAPEQIEGKSLDHRTDIYSLGCVAFEALTGAPPFSKETDVAVMYAHLMDPRPTITEKRPDLPASLDAVMNKVMAKDPLERYGSAGSFSEELEEILAPRGAATVPGPAAGRSSDAAIRSDRPPGVRRLLQPKMLAALGLGLAVVVGAVALFTGGDEERGARDRASGAAVSGAASEAVVVAPDGSDGGEGTADDPVGSVQEAIDMAGEGGTVVLRDGIYEAQGNDFLAVIQQPVTIEAAEGATPIIRGGSQGGNGFGIEAGTSSVTIRGISFEALGKPLKVFCQSCEKEAENGDLSFEKLSISGSTTGIFVENAETVRLDEVTISDTVESGFLCNPGPCNAVEIARSSFEGASGSESDGIQIVSGEEVLIEDTVVRDNGSDGMDIDAAFVQIVRSESLDNAGSGLLLWPANAFVSDSIFARNGGEGISACAEGCDAGGTFTAGNILVAANGSRSGANAMTVADDQPTQTTVELFNSLFTENRGTPLVLGPKVDVARIDFNLFDAAAMSRPMVTWKGRSYDGNDLNRSRLPGSNDEGTYFARPSFVGPDDYHLKSDSSGVDGGTDVGMSATDLDGNPRPQGTAPDMGPYEQ